MNKTGFCIFAALFLSSTASDAFDATTSARAFATYTDAIRHCDRQMLEKIVRELAENFFLGSCDKEIQTKITHIMSIDDVTIDLICSECTPAPEIGDQMVFSIRKEPGFDWLRCSHLFREFDEGWQLISWSCGDYQ